MCVCVCVLYVCACVCVKHIAPNKILRHEGKGQAKFIIKR